MLVEKFMIDEATALPFLALSSLVPRGRLAAVAAHGPLFHACAVAGRDDLDADLVARLAQRAEIEVLRTLGQNGAAPLADDDFARLAAAGRRDLVLGRALCRRSANPLALAPLFLYAVPEQRRAIIAAFRQAGLAEIERPPRTMAEELGAEEIERAALSGDGELLVALLARLLGTSLIKARELVDDPHGEPLAVTFAALRIRLDAAPRIFMSLRREIAQSFERVKALCSLTADLPPQTARRLIGQIVGVRGDGEGRVVRQSVADAHATATPSRAANNAHVRPVVTDRLRPLTRAVPKR
jgi:hypothetical protein